MQLMQNSIFMNTNQLNVTYKNQTTRNEIKKLSLCICFEFFAVPTESFCKRHCNATALTLFDRGVRQKLYFSIKAPG
jgi:hypothetical protein